jgi:alkylhydroperoxidase/carboxymuconolactone decarboxylase family protein YurZ
MSKTDLQEARAHYLETLKNMPGAIRAMDEYAPEAFLGYTRMRKYINRRPPAGALDVKTKELLYVVMDIICGNLDGAKNHLDAGLRAGITMEELTEACVMTLQVFGVQSWGKTGYHVLDYARDVIAAGGPDAAKAKAKAKPAAGKARGKR